MRTSVRARLRSSIALKVFVAMALALVLSSAAAVAIDARLTRSQIRRQALRELESELRTLTAAVDDHDALLFEAVGGAAQRLRSASLTEGALANEIIAELAHVRRTFGLDLLQVVERGGRTVASLGPELRARPAIEPGGLGVSATRVLVTEDGRFVQTTWAPVRAGARTLDLFAGYLFDDALAYELRSLVGQEVLLLSEGRLVGSTLSGAPSEPPLLEEGRGLPRAPGAANVAGVESLVFYAPVGGATFDDPTAALGLVAPEPLAALDASLLRGRVIVAGFLTLVAAALSWALIRILTRPLVALSKAAGGIAEGRLQVPRGVRSTDEVGILASSLERMRKLDEAKSLFVANAAHELRGPLTTIAGFATTLATRRRQMTLEQIEQSIEAINRQGQRLRVLATSLLDLSQIERDGLTMTLEPVALEPVARAALAGAAPPPGSRVDLAVPADAVVAADRVRLEQVLTNLLVNAYRYGGPRVRVVAEVSEERVGVSVCDDGEGVPADLVATLFEPFARGSNAAGTLGSGLGLAIVRGLVEAMGGRLWYEAGDPGARFHFELARATRAAVPTGPAAAAVPGRTITLPDR